jgi:hypothetical protein
MILWFVLLAVFALATAAVGWWTVPIVAAAWGLTRPSGSGSWWTAALAASASWAVLLAATAMRGPVVELASVIGGVFKLPGFAMIFLSLLFPALLAGSAAELTAVLHTALARSR